MPSIYRSFYDDTTEENVIIITGQASDGTFRRLTVRHNDPDPRAHIWLRNHAAEIPALLEDAEYDRDSDGNKAADLESIQQQITDEIAWLDSAIANIDTMDARQVREVVKRVLAENRQILRAIRWMSRRIR